MKIINIGILFTLLLALTACSEDSATASDSTTTDTPATTSTTNTILQPSGAINDAVLGELKQGRWELVVFWATYCPVCKRDFEKLATFIQDNPEIPLTIVGVVVDGVEQKDKAIHQINERQLNYTHVLTDFDHGNALYTDVTESALIGVPSQLLYNTENKLVGFSRNAIDLDALEIVVYE